jgi:hypothetical protein
VELKSTLEGIEGTFWNRHSNPKSGWSRTVLLPVILYATYRRNWNVAAVAAVFTLLNPILFSPPENEDAWMTRVVLAERWWKERGNGVIGLTYPTVLNAVNVPVTAYAVVAAYRQRPLRAALAGVASMALKLWYVAALVREYDAETKTAP